jgi:hypothetical protein
MVYASPVHVQEHLGELANSAFSADRQWRGGGMAGAVVMDAASQIVGKLWFVAACLNSIGHLCIRCHPKKNGGALHMHCTFWCTVRAVHLVTVELHRFHTKSRSSAPKGALHMQCTKRNTAPEFLKIQPFLVSFTVIIIRTYSEARDESIL